MANQPLYSPINPHFFQPLLPGFTNHLDIPVAFFLKHLEKSNKGKTAKLRSDASETTWMVKIEGRRFSDGWEDFTVAHDLRVGDIVVFRHEEELVFHVTALGPSCCEIQYGEDSQEEEKMEQLCDTTEKISRKKKRLETEMDSSTDQSCFVITVTASNLRRDVVYLPKDFAVLNSLMKKFEIVLMNEERDSWKIDLRHEAYSDRFYMSRGWRSFCVANRKKPGDMFRFKLVQSEETPVLKMFPMNNEDQHKLENVPKKKRQEIEADSLPDHSSFVAIVTASNLRRDTVYLPKTFAVSNGLIEKFEIELVNEKGVSWTIDLRHEPYSDRYLMRRGWRSFCLANGKKAGDMFNFKLVRNDDTPVLKLLPLNLPKLEPRDDTRQGLESTEKELLGVEANRNDTRQGCCFKASDKDELHSAGSTTDAMRKGKYSEANETTIIKEDNSTINQNRFVTLTLTPATKVNLPLGFTKENGIINKSGKIKMIDRYGTKWSTSLLMNKKERGAMSLGKGVKGFCEVNGVKMGESFVLELVWEDAVPVLKFCSKY